MSRAEVIEAAIATSLEFGQCHGLQLSGWIAEFWQLGLFVVAVALGLRQQLPAVEVYSPRFTGPFVTLGNVEQQWFGHPWLPVYFIDFC